MSKDTCAIRTGQAIAWEDRVIKRLLEMVHWWGEAEIKLEKSPITAC